MKNALLLSLGVVALSSCGYDSYEECVLRETQKGAERNVARDYCYGEYTPRGRRETASPSEAPQVTRVRLPDGTFVEISDDPEESMEQLLDILRRFPELAGETPTSDANSSGGEDNLDRYNRWLRYGRD